MQPTPPANLFPVLLFILLFKLGGWQHYEPAMLLSAFSHVSFCGHPSWALPPHVAPHCHSLGPRLPAPSLSLSSLLSPRTPGFVGFSVSVSGFRPCLCLGPCLWPLTPSRKSKHLIFFAVNRFNVHLLVAQGQKRVTFQIIVVSGVSSGGKCGKSVEKI